MWFKPLQEIVGDIVNYEESSSGESLDSKEQAYMKLLRDRNMTPLRANEDMIVVKSEPPIAVTSMQPA